MIVALGIQGVMQFNHLRWDEGLENYRKQLQTNDDWLMVFSRAIDIYVGKIKGFKDVPEEQFMRKELMKGELKVLIANIISEQLNKWAKERISKAGKTVEQKKTPSQPKQQEPDKDYNPFENPYEDNPYSIPDSPSPKKVTEKVLNP